MYKQSGEVPWKQQADGGNFAPVALSGLPDSAALVFPVCQVLTYESHFTDKKFLLLFKEGSLLSSGGKQLKE